MRNHPRVLLWASAGFRDIRNAFTELGTRYLLGFFPLQRHDHPDVTNEIPASPLPAPRLSQPFSRCFTSEWFAGLFHPAGTHRVWPTKSDLEVIVIRFPYACFFVVIRLSWFPFATPADFPATIITEVYPFPRCSGLRPLVSLRRPAPTLDLDQP